MSRTTKIDADTTIGGKALAELLGLTTRRLEQLAAAGTIVRTGRGRYALQASVQRYAEALRDAAAGRGASDLTAARARLARAQAEAAELELERKRGAWLLAAAVESLNADALVAFRNIVRRIPVSAMTALGLSPAQTRKLAFLLDQALDELARKLERIADGKNGPARARKWKSSA